MHAPSLPLQTSVLSRASLSRRLHTVLCVHKTQTCQILPRLPREAGSSGGTHARHTCALSCTSPPLRSRPRRGHSRRTSREYEFVCGCLRTTGRAQRRRQPPAWAARAARARAPRRARAPQQALPPPGRARTTGKHALLSDRVEITSWHARRRATPAGTATASGAAGRSARARARGRHAAWAGTYRRPAFAARRLLSWQLPSHPRRVNPTGFTKLMVSSRRQPGRLIFELL